MAFPYRSSNATTVPLKIHGQVCHSNTPLLVPISVSVSIYFDDRKQLEVERDCFILSQIVFYPLKFSKEYISFLNLFITSSLVVWALVLAQ